jgi:copper transport protein
LIPCNKLLLGLFGAALLFPAAASAHATMERSSPGFRERLATAPRAVSLRFDQAVEVLPNAIVVVDASGRRISGTAVGESDPRRITVPVRTAPRGAYTVRWHAMSADGHVVSGVFTYGVRVAAPPPTGAFGASGPTTTEHVVRWLYFLGLALLVGGLGFRLLVLGRGPAPRALDKRFYVVAGIGALVVLEVGIAAFILRAEDALQLPFERLLYGDLSPIAGGTRFGQAFIAMELGFAFVTAFLYLAWLTDRTWLLWPAFLLGIGFASGLSLSGHAATTSRLAELADWVHLAAATLWVGGLVQLLLVVWPAAPALRGGAFLRFSRYATVLVATLLAAGIYLSVLRLPRLADLWEASYGQVLLVKLGLVALALAWGAAHHFLVRPRIERPGSERLLARVTRSLAAESAVAMGILLVAAILVDSKPPL